MAFGKIKEALEKMVDDLTTVEVVTLNDQNDPVILGYTRIDLDGDILSYGDNNVAPQHRRIHVESINAAVANRRTTIKFLINLSKESTFK